jgi:diadenosine tetraphosphate (Ap4A) HIT family hydrolase
VGAGQRTRLDNKAWIPRYETDPDWGQAPWRENEATLSDAEMKALAGKIAGWLETY